MSALLLLSLLPAQAQDRQGSTFTYNACLVATGDHDKDGIPNSEDPDCKQSIVERQGNTKVEHCALYSKSPGCVPGRVTSFADNTTTDHDIEPLRPGLFLDAIDGWAIGVGGKLPVGLNVFDPDAEVVARALETGDVSDVTVAVQLTNALHTEVVGFSIVDEGPYGQFIVAQDVANEAGGAFRIGLESNVGVFDNMPADVREETGAL